MSIQLIITDPATIPVKELEAAIDYLSLYLPEVEEEDLISKYVVGERNAEDLVAEIQRLAGYLPDTYKVSIVESETENWNKPAVAHADFNPAIAFSGNTTMTDDQALNIITGETDVSNYPELDAEQMPWDGRIHSAGKTKNANGTWRGRRGVSDDVYNKVVAEIKSMMGVGAGGSGPGAHTPIMGAGGISGDMTATGAGTPIPNVNADPYAQFMLASTAAIGEGRFTQEYVYQILAKHSIPSIPMLAVFPDRIPAIRAELGI